ncbi:MAG: hypothetical protein NVS3B16_25150 [Vulcanimicrobiaceae bacterium]
MRWFGRLRRSSEIAFVRRRGRVVGRPTLAVYACETPGGPPRVAVTVSKAVGGAVVRNRVRRRIRGALDGLPPPELRLRLLFVAKPAAAEAAYALVLRDVTAALERLAVKP